MPENSGAHSGKHQRASGLTPRQADVLALIQKRTKEDNASPTYREIGEALGITSTNGVADHVKALIRKGYLRQGPNRAPRNLQPTTKSQAKHDLVVAVPIIDRSRRKWIRLDRSLLPLDVGLGTFANITEKNIKEKRLHKERFEIPNKSKEMIKEQRELGLRVAAVGTTSVRTLEANAELILKADIADIRGETDIFILPPYNFKIVDTLITNFHLPGTSLILLVEAFLQHKKSARSVSELYKIAIQNKFRFYSFGDSMLII
jgi:DNA-binding MarR family transcriptional regulator